MKLNLGCGYHKRSGFLNVDVRSECLPDMTVDLERTPWPWESDSAALAKGELSPEHVEQLSRERNNVIKEISISPVAIK